MEKVSSKDRTIIRDLAKRYVEICEADRNQTARALWRDHNSLKETRPPVLVCSFWDLRHEIDPILEKNQTENLGWVELFFKRYIWQATNIEDDTVFNPWLPMNSIRRKSEGFWGFETNIVRDEKSQGHRAFPVVRNLEDLAKFQATPHEVIDRNPPEIVQMREILDGIMPVHVVTSTAYNRWGGTDLAEAVGKLIGLEEFMVMIYDQPELLHQFMSFMRDAVLANLEKGEADGDWTTADGWSYAVNDTWDLPAPRANSYGAKLKDLWFFTHAQEFETVGPAQHEEFLLNYQMPIMQKFGLVNYGCCETLDNKIDMLRKIPNLRTIGIGPMANVRNCAQKIGKDYLMSWRPSPAMVSSNYEIEDCRKIVRQGFADSKGCHIHVMLKELMTVENDPQRLIEWGKMAMEEAQSI